MMLAAGRHYVQIYRAKNLNNFCTIDLHLLIYISQHSENTYSSGDHQKDFCRYIVSSFNYATYRIELILHLN